MRTVLVFVLSLVLTGCVFFDIAQQQAVADASVRLVGRVDTTTPEDAPLIALLVRWTEDRESQLQGRERGERAS